MNRSVNSLSKRMLKSAQMALRYGLLKVITDMDAKVYDKALPIRPYNLGRRPKAWRVRD